MALSFDVYWSFRSPYCYLLAQRLMNFERDYHVRCNVKIVYPIAVRIPGFFKTLNPLYWPGAVAELVGIEGGVVSGVINLESSGVEASDWRPRHDEHYHEV